jgi:hypothetical protein
MGNDGKDVVMIAVWSKGLHNVCDAYEVAKSLGYRSKSSNKHKRLENHLDEYLVFIDNQKRSRPFKQMLLCLF